MASSWAYSGYTNPYYATVIAAQPAQTTVVYDYSQPINVTSPPPDASVAESNEQVFSAARDSFKAGDYSRALDLTDQVLKQTPNEAVVQSSAPLSVRLKRYDEAASVNYAVLTAGPGWNWSTMVGLYPDVDTYTNQLRALEAYARSNPSSASRSFCWRINTLLKGIPRRRARCSTASYSFGPTTSFGVVRQALQKGRGAEKGRRRRRLSRPGANCSGSAAPPHRPASRRRPPSQPATVAAEQPPASRQAAATPAEQPELPPPPPARWSVRGRPRRRLMFPSC